MRDLIEVTRLENAQDLAHLVEGDVVMLSLGSGEINDFNEYHGLAVYIGERLNGTKDCGLDFCRPQANLGDCLVGYHVNSEEIIEKETGVISAKKFFTYGCKQPQIKSLGSLK